MSGDGMQRDVFGGNAQPPGLHFEISHQQQQVQRALAAYRNNIALPDVHVASRHDRSQPPVLGEDGEEMTFERRASLMAGKRPMLEQTPDGRVRIVDQDFSQQFDEDIGQERLGKSAIENRPGMRVVRPKELELGVTEVGGTMAPEGTWIPGTEGDVSRCLYTAPNVNHTASLITELHACIRAVVGASGDRRLACRGVSASSRALQRISQALGGDCESRLLGIPVTVVPHRDNEIRFHADHEVPDLAGSYASLFLIEPLLPVAVAEEVDECPSHPDQGDTQIMPALDAEPKERDDAE